MVPGFPIPAWNDPDTLCTWPTLGIPSTATANICRRRKTKIVGLFLYSNTIAIIDLNVMRAAVPIPAVVSASVLHSAAVGGSVVGVVRLL